MSERWPGGIVRSTPVTPTGPFQNGTAPGIWTMEQAAYWTKQGLWPIAGNQPTVVEDVFSTYVYTGTGAGFTGSEQTIQNGINISGQGGMVWIKARVSTNSFNAFYNRHQIYDTQRGFSNLISSNTTDAQVDTSTAVQPLTNGFILASGGSYYGANYNGLNYVSWTFREAPKFFDVVTYTGNGTAGRTISHNLGVAPGCIMVKHTNGTTDWYVYHRGTGATNSLQLNQTAAAAADSGAWNNTAPTATDFTVGSSGGTNGAGRTYVAYLFAHNTASDGFIQCGSYSGTGAVGNAISLGWEPQWLLVKNATSGGQEWGLFDNIRGLAANSSGGDAQLFANDASTEGNSFYFAPTATGFSCEDAGARYNASGSTYIYIAIRRGPMRTPTLGTSVFTPIAWSGTGSATSVTGTSYPVDMAFVKARNTNSNGPIIVDRLRSVTNTLYSPYTQSESANSYVTGSDIMNGLKVGTDLDTNMSGVTYVYEMFRRAPGFFDEVCYTGTGAATTAQAHNLGVAPELIIVKSRNAAGGWFVNANLTSTTMTALTLSTTNAGDTGAYSFIGWLASQPTLTTFTPISGGALNSSGTTYVAYLFASCPGVSKVGSYTGNGTSQTINCGFTTGARFFLVKRTDSTGNWFVWDSARGIVAGNDPYYAMNNTNGDDYLGAGDIVDADNSGIIVNQESTCNINVNAATYIYLAIS